MLSPPRNPSAGHSAAPFTSIVTALGLLLACTPVFADFEAGGRGDCLSMAKTASLTPWQVDAIVATFGVEAQLFPDAICGATLYALTYRTVAPDDNLTVASAGLIMPANCAGPFPLVEYNHGTWTTTHVAMGDPAMHTVQEVVAQFGAQGYAVVMPDYLGYDASTTGYHPYLNARSNADVTMDAVRAARNCMADRTPSLNDDVFLAGTSEGGYVTMATQRAMEAQDTRGFRIVAVVATSGPYALVDSTMEMLRNNDGVPGYAWMQLQGYQDTWGDVYVMPTEVFQQPYATEPGFQTLLPNEQTMAQLTRAGELPPRLEGWNGLLTEAFVRRYLANPNEPARVHAQANDLRTFAPRAPLALCYGSLDTQAMANAQTAAAYFLTRGVVVPLTDIQTLPQFQRFIEQMGTAKYHSNVEAPACVAWTRQTMFDPLRGPVQRD